MATRPAPIFSLSHAPLVALLAGLALLWTAAGCGEEPIPRSSPEGAELETNQSAARSAQVRWSDVTNPGPLPSTQQEVSLAFDERRGRLVLYVNRSYQVNPGEQITAGELWEFDGVSWDWVPRQDVWPTGGSQPVFVYDPVGERIVLYGGSIKFASTQDPQELVNDSMWSWDGQVWQELDQGDVRPAPLHARLGVFDRARGRLVVTSGYLESSGYDPTRVWEFSMEDRTWTSVVPADVGLSNNPRALTWDSNREQIVGYLGSALYEGVLAAWNTNASRWDVLTGSRRQGTIFDRPRLAYLAESDQILEHELNLLYAPLTFERSLLSTGQLSVFDEDRVESSTSLFAYDPAGGRHYTYNRGTLRAFDGQRWLNASPDAVEHVSVTPREGLVLASDQTRPRVFGFGGRSQSYGGREDVFPSDTWEWSDGKWTRHDEGPQPRGRLGHDMASLPMPSQLVLFGGYDAEGVCLEDTWVRTENGWEARTPLQSPTPRLAHAMAFDPGSGRVLLFGGRECETNALLDDLWAWDGDNWQLLAPGGDVPAARYGHDLTSTDEGIAMLGGGTSANSGYPELWHYNEGTWSLISEINTPGPPPFFGSASRLAGDDDIVYFTEQGIFVWTGAAWIRVVEHQNNVLVGLDRMWPAGLGGIQAAHEVAAMPWAGEHLRWLGGRTLSWSGSWKDLTPLHSTLKADVPTLTNGNQELAAAYDPDNDEVILYLQPGALATPGRTWIWEVGALRWREVTPEWRDVAYLDSRAGFASTRRGARMVWDGSKIRLIAGEGSFLDDSEVRGQNWTLDRTTGRWTSASGGDFSARTLAAYVSAGEDVIAQGGRGADGILLSDTWRCALGVFPRVCNELSGDQSPSARYKHALGWAPSSDLALLFGGIDANGVKPADTWLLDEAGWRPLQGRYCTPSPRTDHAMAYHPGSDTIVLYGGLEGALASPRVSRELWVFDLANERWILVPSERPLPHAHGHGLVTTRDGEVLAVGNRSRGHLPREVLSIDVALSDLDFLPSEVPEGLPVGVESAIAFDRSELPAGTDLVLPSLPSGAEWDSAAASLRWTPSADQIGTHELVVALVGEGYCLDDTLSVEVIAFVNTPPVALDQEVETSTNTPVDIPLEATDADGHALSYRVTADPLMGSVALADGVATYTPALDQSGTETFQWVANDGFDDSNVATVTIQILPGNAAPRLNPAPLTTAEDTPATIDVVAIDADNDDVTLSVFNAPSFGELALEGFAVTYTPQASYHGEDSFDLVGSDGVEEGAPATFAVLVTPIIEDVSARTDEGVAVSLLLSSDDDFRPLSFAIVDGPQMGEVTLNGALATYTPTADFSGEDTFTFRGDDSFSGSNVATATIYVGLLNVAPMVEDASVETDEDVPVAIAIAISDLDANDVHTLAIETAPAHGEVEVNGTAVVYSPEANYFGDDSFTVVANDGTASSAPALVSVVVRPINDPPLLDPVDDQIVEVGQELSLRLEAVDPDGDTLTFDVDSLPDGLTLDADSGLISGTVSDAALAASPIATRAGASDGVARAEIGFSWTVKEANTGEGGDNNSDDNNNDPTGGDTNGAEDGEGEGGAAYGTESPACDCSATEGRPTNALWLVLVVGVAFVIRRSR